MTAIGATGVYGHNTVGIGNGIIGYSDAGRGVWGHSNEAGIGVLGESATGIGVQGKGGHRAGFFDGDVEVTGDIQCPNGDCAEDFTLDKPYSDPCCIMSQQNGFLNPPWMRSFGPAICLPHLVQRDWMYHRRLYVDEGGWMSQADGVTIPLAPLTKPQAAANLGIKLGFRRGGDAWDYYIQCQPPTGWDRGLLKSYVFVRKIARTREGVSPIILGGVFTPDTIGASAEYIEPTGNVRFRVQLSGLPGPVVMVNAAML